MKLLIKLTFLLSLCSLCACKGHQYPHILATADSLTYANPDSAITLLKNLKTEMAHAPEATQMYYRLLRIKADDKAYIGHTSDNAILPIVAYYEKKKDKSHLMEAYYFAGRVYSDLSDAPQALSYFQKAAEASQGGTDYRVISRIYSQIGELSLYQDIYDEALVAYRKAYLYNILAKDSTGLVLNLRDIARNYTALNRADSSLYYYKAALALAKKLNNQRYMNIVQGELADLYIQLKKYDEARKALQSSLNGAKKVNQDAFYATTSRFYYQIGVLDSASYYADRLIKEHSTIYAQQTGHWILAQIAEQKGDCQTAIKQIQQYTACTDSIQKITKTATIRKMQSVYNYQLREKENDRLRAKNAEQKLVITYALLGFIILIALIAIYMLYNKRKKDQLQAQLQRLKEVEEEQYKKSTQFIEENKKRIEELEAQLEQEKEEKHLQLVQLQKKQYERNINRAMTNRRYEEAAEELFHNSDIYVCICKKATDKEEKMTDKEWEELTVAINATYNDFTSRLLALHRFSSIEMKICLLLKAKFPVTAIANLIMRSKPAITSARRAMYEKVHGFKGKAEDWDAFIASF